MHKTGVLAARILRFKRNQEMENYLRYQIGRVKIRLLDEEYYPGVFNIVERVVIFLRRLAVWVGDRRWPLADLWAVPLAPEEVRHARHIVNHSFLLYRLAGVAEQIQR